MAFNKHSVLFGILAISVACQSGAPQRRVLQADQAEYCTNGIVPCKGNHIRGSQATLTVSENFSVTLTFNAKAMSGFTSAGKDAPGVSLILFDANKENISGEWRDVRVLAEVPVCFGLNEVVKPVTVFTREELERAESFTMKINSGFTATNNNC